MDGCAPADATGVKRLGKEFLGFTLEMRLVTAILCSHRVLHNDSFVKLREQY